VYKNFQLTQQTVTRNAQINCFFNVYEESKARAKTRSPQRREAATTLLAPPSKANHRMLLQSHDFSARDKGIIGGFAQPSISAVQNAPKRRY
jgi:hypothetical protein